MNVTIVYLNGTKEHIRQVAQITIENGFYVLKNRQGFSRKYDCRVKLEVSVYAF